MKNFFLFLSTHRKRFVAVCAINIVAMFALYGIYMNHSVRLVGALPLMNIFASVLDHNISTTHPDIVATVALGSGITSRGVRHVTPKNIAAKFVFFHTFLPSFCRTASPGFVYVFYLAYDYNDRVFANQALSSAFRRVFDAETRRLCPRTVVVESLRLVRCSHNGKPTWAQNDAMREAYIDHVDYFYRINDDTRMLTPGWTEVFVDVLAGYDPPNVGVVGPNHSGGNVAILTYDFVHRTHVDIFGFYYPRLFTDWFGDGWITRVYKPKRSTKVSKIRLDHTLGMGTRYKVNHAIGKLVEKRLVWDRATLKRYLNEIKARNASPAGPDGRKVVALTLTGSVDGHVWGAIRNAQLLPVYLPTWTLQVYISNSSQFSVPERVQKKLQQLGAQIIHVPDVITGSGILPQHWNVLVADNHSVDYFLVRNTDWRLSEREAAAVTEWVEFAEESGPDSAVVHCIRDHPKHADRGLVDGLWGGRPRGLQRRLNRTVVELLTRFNATNWEHTLDHVLWPAVSNNSYCHDSVSPCDRWLPTSNRHGFAVARSEGDFVGQRFDEHQEPLTTASSGHVTAAEVTCQISRNTSTT